MRIGDLIGATLIDSDGTAAHVVDVRLVQDGPLLGQHAALRLDGLLVSRRRVHRLLGYERPQGPRRPVLVRWLVRWLHDDIRYAAWGELADSRPGSLALRCPLDALPRLQDL